MMMNMFQQQPAPEVHALIGVIDLIVSNQRPSSRVAERYSAMSRDGIRLVVRGALPYSEAVYARFAFARVSLEGWHLGEGRGALAEAVIATAEAVLVLADGRNARPGDKAAILDAAALLTDTVAKPAHRQVDHGFRAGREGFVVPGRAAVEHQPAVGALDRPPFRNRGKAPGPGRALDDLHVDAEAGGVLDQVRAVAAVDPDLAQAGVGGGDAVEQLGAGGGVLHAGTQLPG
ncbi:hypothetical protein EV384_3973 [Micromonospora kangleipakensis]|uniref:Uncharacterized protein n=2 Tax=Micromonospora kangleipakensis TaxID=1077942 RepID=A0A4Q8B7D4_9ACTN|nr:hypothetical protein EV384_1977 [Micromonospora kangleipakensis]RZU75432.1 hypothetical protein EV384_3973 [Micromonospora kangleipakensis]